MLYLYRFNGAKVRKSFYISKRLLKKNFFHCPRTKRIGIRPVQFSGNCPGSPEFPVAEEFLRKIRKTDWENFFRYNMKLPQGLSPIFLWKMFRVLFWKCPEVYPADLPCFRVMAIPRELLHHAEVPASTPIPPGKRKAPRFREASRCYG